jgi:hypothetical protein
MGIYIPVIYYSDLAIPAQGVFAATPSPNANIQLPASRRQNPDYIPKQETVIDLVQLNYSLFLPRFCGIVNREIIQGYMV